LEGMGLSRMLKRLHRWNAWTILFLALTGIVLSIGAIRGDLGEGRVWIKQVQIWVGFISAALIVLYIPNMKKHWKQLRRRGRQKLNLIVVLILLVGWTISGVILSFYQHFTPGVNNVALIIHDGFTWIGIPYALYHSIIRLKWLRR